MALADLRAGHHEGATDDAIGRKRRLAVGGRVSPCARAIEGRGHGARNPLAALVQHGNAPVSSPPPAWRRSKCRQWCRK